MHYMEVHTPKEINEQYAPSDAVNKIYPPEEWFIKGLIKETYIGNCHVMYFDILDVVSLCAEELKNSPFELWGIKE